MDDINKNERDFILSKMPAELSEHGAKTVEDFFAKENVRITEEKLVFALATLRLFRVFQQIGARFPQCPPEAALAGALMGALKKRQEIKKSIVEKI